MNNLNSLIEATGFFLEAGESAPQGRMVPLVYHAIIKVFFSPIV